MMQGFPGLIGSAGGCKGAQLSRRAGAGAVGSCGGGGNDARPVGPRSQGTVCGLAVVRQKPLPMSQRPPPPTHSQARMAPAATQRLQAHHRPPQPRRRHSPGHICGRASLRGRRGDPPLTNPACAPPPAAARHHQPAPAAECRRWRPSTPPLRRQVGGDGRTATQPANPGAPSTPRRLQRLAQRAGRRAGRRRAPLLTPPPPLTPLPRRLCRRPTR